MNPSEVCAEVPELVRPLRRIEFDALAAAGCFEEERVELLFGSLVAMSPTDPAHDTSISRLGRMLTKVLEGRAEVRIQCSFAATDDSEPLPDIVVAPLGDYWREHPSRAVLVVEVARSSLRKDRGLKRRVYGAADVDEYWIVNHTDDRVEVHRRVAPGGEWHSPVMVGRGQRLSPLGFPDVVIVVDEILPPP